MYIIKNAIKNLSRYKVRYMMIGTIMLVIILTTSISLIINSTTSSIIDTYKAQFGSEVFVDLDFEKLQNNPNQTFKQISAAEFIKFGESDLLHSKEYYGSMFVKSDKKSVGENEDNSNVIMTPSIGGNQVPDDIVPPTVNVVGSTNPKISEDFASGARKITDGKMYEALNECIISQEYAKLNNLKVGDKIKLSGVEKSKNMTEELTISGIYADNTPKENNDNMMGMPAMMKRENEIITSFDTLAQFEMFTEYGQVSPTFYLKDPSMLEAFQQELRDKGLYDYYKVTTDEASYNAIVKPVEGLSNITMTFVYVILALGAIVLTIVFSMAIRERKYEIGVLRTMGMKKGSVAFGIISEVFIVTTITLIVGLTLAIFTAQPVADKLLANQINQIENEKENVPSGTGSIVIGGMPETPDPLSEIKVTLETDAIIKIIAVAFSLGLLSSVISVFYITKYEPMKILAERN